MCTHESGYRPFSMPVCTVNNIIIPHVFDAHDIYRRPLLHCPSAGVHRQPVQCRRSYIKTHHVSNILTTLRWRRCIRSLTGNDDDDDDDDGGSKSLVIWDCKHSRWRLRDITLFLGWWGQCHKRVIFIYWPSKLRTPACQLVWNSMSYKKSNKLTRAVIRLGNKYSNAPFRALLFGEWMGN